MAADLSHLRPIVSGLHGDGIISQEEQQMLIKHLAGKSDITEENLREAAGLVSNSEQVLKKLNESLRLDVGMMEELSPAQPASEPQAPATLISDLLSKE